MSTTSTSSQRIECVSPRRPAPRRGEIWQAALDPTVGCELSKTRPVLVVNLDEIGVLPIRLVIPVTSWKPNRQGKIWHVVISPDALNGLDKPGTLDMLQLRCCDESRFLYKRGRVSADQMDEIVLSLVTIVVKDLARLIGKVAGGQPKGCH